MALSRPYDPYSGHVPDLHTPEAGKRPQVAADEADAGRTPQQAAEPKPTRGRRAQQPGTRRRAAPRKRRAGKPDPK